MCLLRYFFITARRPRLLLLSLEICGKSRWLSKIARAAYFAVEAIFVR